MGRGGEETDVGRMTTVDVWVRDTAEDGEIIAVFLKEFEIRRRRVIAASAFGEKVLRQQSEIVADGEHSARRVGSRGLLRARERKHRIKKRQGESCARAFEKVAT